MSSGETMSYHNDVAEAVRQEILPLLEEHWSVHQHSVIAKADSVLNLLEPLIGHLPPGEWSEAVNALTQWSAKVREQYDALRSMVETYQEGVGELVQTDIANSRGFEDHDG